MMNNFRVVSVSAMMAAFAATSAWAAAASACPTDDGWSENKKTGECFYDIQDGEQTPTVPSTLKSFKLRYLGASKISHAIVNLDNPNGTQYTFSIEGNTDLTDGGLLTIKNRLNLVPYVGATYAPLLSAFDLKPAYTEDAIFSCNSAGCTVPKETGFNALTVELNGAVEGKDQFVALTVVQELFDFTSLEVYHTKGISYGTVDDIYKKAGSLIPKNFPIEKIQAAMNAGYKSLALLHGNGENDKLTSIPADINVDYVYLDRTFTTNDAVENARSTIAFPFDIATDNIQGASEILQFTRIGKDDKNNDVVFMKKVYCANPTGDKCPATNGTLKAYKPYIVQLKSGVTSLEFDGPVTLKATPEESDYADFADPNSYWVFRGVFEKHTWKEAPANTYGYAASGKDEKGNDLAGKFVKVGAGAYIYPFRGVLTYAEPLKAAPANSSYALRPNVLPDEMNIVVEGDNNETTVIGRFNTRTGEMKFINNLKHTYDLKGRRVNGVNNARGAYYGKKVMR